MADKEKKVSPDSNAEKATAEEKAAEKIAKAAKGKKSDKPNFFVRVKKGSKKFFKDFKGECKKIDWPDAKTVLKSTGIVLVVVAMVSAFVFGLDFCLKEGIEGLKTAAIGTTETLTDGNVSDGNATNGNVSNGDAQEETTVEEITAADTTAEDTTADAE